MDLEKEYLFQKFRATSILFCEPFFAKCTIQFINAFLSKVSDIK